MVQKQGHMTFPPTKFRPGEDLYSAMIRPLQEDLALPPGSFLPEKELERWAKAVEPVRKKWVAEVDSKGLPGQKLLDGFDLIWKKYAESGPGTK